MSILFSENVSIKAPSHISVSASGSRIDESAAALSCRVEGGELLGVFSADPKSEDAYGTPACHAYEGRALAILRAAAPGEVVLAVSSPGLPEARRRLSAQAPAASK